AAVAAVGQQLVRAEGTRSDHYPARRQRGPLPAEPGARALARHPVAVRAVRRATGAGGDVGDLPLRQDVHAELLREPEVVLHQRVLGVVPAADHAAPAADAAGPGRALAAEVGVRNLPAGLPEEGADPGVLVGLGDPDLLAVLLEEEIGRALERIVGHPE